MSIKLIDENKIMTKLSHTEPVFGEDGTKSDTDICNGWQIQNAIKELKPERAIVISEETTNGNIIEIIFDVKEIHAMIKTVFVVLKDDTELEFNREWYEAPFKRTEE